MLGLIRPLISLKFWFHVQAVPLVPWADRFVLFLMTTCLFGGIACSVASRMKTIEKERRRFLRRLALLLVWAAVAGFLLYAFTWQRVPILSMRFFYFAWLAGFGWWAWTILRHAFVVSPRLKAERAEREAYEKWLPKPKKK